MQPDLALLGFATPPFVLPQLARQTDLADTKETQNENLFPFKQA